MSLPTPQYKKPADVPELPEPDYWSTRDDETPLFTADQMRAYGAACRAAPAGGVQPVATLALEALIAAGFVSREKADEAARIMAPFATPTAALTLARVALADLIECPFYIDAATVPKSGIESAPWQVVGNISVALPKIRNARAARAAIDALPASVPSGELAAKKPHGCAHRNGQFCGKAGPCLYPKCAPTVPAAPTPAAVPAGWRIEATASGGHAVHAPSGAACIVRESEDSPRVVLAVVLAELCGDLLAARTQAPAVAPLLVRDLAASVKAQPLDVSKVLESLGYGKHSINMAVPADAIGAVETYFAARTQAQAAPAVAAAEPRTLTEAQIERHSMPASECPPDSAVMLVSSIRRLLGMAAAPTTQEPQQ